MNDAEATRVLLAFLPDALPAPRGGSAPDPGEVGSRKIDCPACHGPAARWRGWRRTTVLSEVRVSQAANPKAVRKDDAVGWWIPCLRCGGSVVSAKGGQGYLRIDSYTLREIATVDSYAAPAPTRWRRVSCLDCNGWGVLPNGKRCKTCVGVGAYDVPHYTPTQEQRDSEDRDSDALQIACDATGSRVSAGLWDRGSFSAVLHSLSQQVAWRRLLVWRAYVTEEHPAHLLPPAQAEQLHVAFHDVVAIALSIERPLRVPPEIRNWRKDERSNRRNGTGRHANVHARGQRNEEIRKLSAEGWSGRRIAREFGMGKSAIADVIKRVAA